MTTPLPLAAVLSGSLAGVCTVPIPTAWGFGGHALAARAAVEGLPAELPAFFRAAGDQLVYLVSEPDRWKGSSPREMYQAWAADHYVDVENLPAGTLDAPDRFAFLRALQEAGIERPERDVGFVHFAIVELYQRVVNGWKRWQAETDPARRRWIGERIVNDAGILGHYVTDASQPQHTTIHFNGWAERAPNPEGYTYDRGFHQRFETAFVDAHVSQEDVSRRVRGTPRSVAGAARTAVVRYVDHSHGQVERLYRLERDVGFDPDGRTRAETRDFAADRLAEGADMLRILWWSAWLEASG